MTSSNKPDAYEQARDIAQNLRGIGLMTQAEEIETCINTGITSTEILMCLRFHLKALLAAKNITLPQALATDARKLLREISKILFLSNFGLAA